MVVELVNIIHYLGGACAAAPVPAAGQHDERPGQGNISTAAGGRYRLRSRKQGNSVFLIIKFIIPSPLLGRGARKTSKYRVRGMLVRFFKTLKNGT